MILLRETHSVRGIAEDEFEAAVRDEWLPALGGTSGARLGYYLNLTHGTGASYNVITYTLLRDGVAWEELVRRIDSGDLKPLVERLDGLRHEVEAKLLVPLPWSPLQEFEIDAIPTRADRHELSVFMEDTVWPHEGKLEEYVERAGSQYVGDYDASFPDVPRLLEIQGAFRPAYGSHRRREILLWQKVVRPKGLLGLITEEMPSEYKKPGRWMLDALELRDQWQSRLLRTSSWSPLY